MTAPSSRLIGMLRWGLVLFALVGAAIVIVEFAVHGSLSDSDIERSVGGYGAAAPVAFIVFFALTGSLVVPTTLLTIAGATLFGRFTGFSYSLIGASLAAMVGFSAARTLGREAMSRWIAKSPGRLARLDRRLERHGFTTALFMRLLYLPNGLINVTCGISAMRASSYALASFIGILPMVFSVSFVTSSAKKAIVRGDWGEVITTETLLAAALFLCCVAIPFVAGAVRRRLRTRDLVRRPFSELDRMFEEENHVEDR